MYLTDTVFRTVIDNTPLVSVDLIVKKEGKILLGRRVNKPAQNYWFTLGGRVLKNETIKDAITRISEMEMGVTVGNEVKFIGVFEHLYDEGNYDNSSTHYVNLAYEIEVVDLENLPKEQHREYRWFSVEELMISNEVHKYVKDYFTEEKGTISQV